jgi:hypothetical protein
MNPMSQLTPCPECQRHVRKNEARCPFCGTALSLAHLPAPALPRKRLGRAATFAFGATVAGATAIAACDDSMSVAPPYGGPAFPPGGSSFAGSTASGSSSGGSANGGTESYFGAGTAVYGAPAAGSGGSDAVGGAGGNPADGGAGGVNEGDGGANIYGAPPAGAGGA